MAHLSSVGGLNEQADEAEEDRIKAEGEKTLTLSELEDGVLSSAASSASSASTAPTSFNTNMKNKDKAAAKGGETEHGEQVGAQLGDTVHGFMGTLHTKNFWYQNIWVY